MAGAIYQTKLTADTSQHDQALGRSANQVYNYKKKCEETDKGVGKLLGKFSKFVGVLSAAKIAGDTFHKMMDNNQEMADRFGVAMETANTITGEFAYAISTMDFSNMFDGLGDLISRAKEYYNALDNLQTLQIALVGMDSKTSADLAEAYRLIKEGDFENGLAKLDAAAAEAERNTQAHIDMASNALDKFVAKYAHATESVRKHGSVGGWILGDSKHTAEAEISTEKVREYLYDAARGGHQLSSAIGQAEAKVKRLREEAGEYNEMNSKWYDVAQAEAYLSALKRVRDELSDGKNLEMFTQLDADINNAKRSLDDLQRTNQRYRDMAAKGNGDTSPQTQRTISVKVKPELEPLPEGSIAELEKKLSDLKLKWRMATTDEERGEIKKAIDGVQEELDKLMGIEKPKVEVEVTPEPPEGSIAAIKKRISELQTELDNTSDPSLRLKIRIEIEGLNNQMNAIAEAMKTPSEEIKEEIDAIEKKYKEMGETVQTVSGMMANAVSTWAEIDQLAFEANEENMTEAEKAEHKRTQAYLKGTAQIVDAVGQAIPAILSLVGAEEAEALAAGTAQAAKLAYPANLAAIATVVASVMTVAATIASLINASKFANGGIVDAASRVGDHNIIRVNGGEMILNDRQQSNLFKLLNGEFWAYYNANNFGIGKHETIQLRISGSDLVGTLDNYNRQQGRAR